MKLQLLSNWRDVMRRAWSVRLFGLALVFECLGIALDVHGKFSGNEVSAIWFQIAGAVFATAGTIARFIKQPSLSKGESNE